MKIVQVIDRLEIGGAEQVLVNLANLLHEYGYKVGLVCLLKEGQLDERVHPDIPITYIRRTNKYNPIYLYKLYKALSRYDIIHIHLRQVLRYVSLLFYLKRLDKKKIVLFHDHFGNIAEEQNLSMSLKKAIKKCSAYIGVSEELALWASNKRLNRKIYTLKNIIVNREIPELDTKKNPEGRVQIVSVGNFRPQKNYEFLIELVKSSPNNYFFTIYGQPIDKPYFEKIMALIDELGVLDKVQVITNCSNIRTELYRYSFGIHTAKSETGPLVALEYLSQGLPYVSYDTGEVAQGIKSEFENFVQNDFVTEHWLQNMEAILRNRNGLIPKLKSYYNKNYSVDVYFKSCISIYEESL